MKALLNIGKILLYPFAAVIFVLFVGIHIVVTLCREAWYFLTHDSRPTTHD